MVTRKVPTIAGMRSKEAPWLVARASPAVVTRESDMVAATIVPTADQAASTLLGA